MVQEIEDNLNNRPRKILGYKIPMEVMMMHQNMQIFSFILVKSYLG